MKAIKKAITLYLKGLCEHYSISHIFQAVTIASATMLVVDYYDFPSKIMNTAPMFVVWVILVGATLVAISWLREIHYWDLVKIPSPNALDSCTITGVLILFIYTPIQLSLFHNKTYKLIACVSLAVICLGLLIIRVIRSAFKQNTPDLVMCIMGSSLYIAQPCVVDTAGVEVQFDEIECFSRLTAPPQDSSREFAVHLGEKCDGTCSNGKIKKCVADGSMICLPKAFYTILPGFRPQPHKGMEYGDVAAQVKIASRTYEMKGIIKKNTANSGRTPKPIDELLNTHLLSTSKAGEEIIALDLLHR